MMNYWIMMNEIKQGPFSIEELNEFYSNELIDEKDKVFSLSFEGQEILVDLKVLFINERKRSESSEKLNQSHKKWHFTDGVNVFGPFSLFEMISMMQNKQINRNTFVRSEDYSDWVLLMNEPEFSISNVSQYRLDDEARSFFHPRRYERKKIANRVLVHDNKSIWNGSAFEVGKGGAGINLSKGDLEIGKTVFIRFQKAENIGPFNSICEVVSYGSESEMLSRRVNLKFKKLSRQSFEKIEHLES